MSDLVDIKIDAGDESESYLSSVHMLRGKIITHFSTVEFMFADLHFRALQLPEYRSLNRNLPYRVKSRVEAVKEIARMAGPINKYQAEILGISDEILSFENLRQFMAHGNMLVNLEASQREIIFIVFDQPKNSDPILRHKYTNLKELSKECLCVGRYSENVIRVLHKVITELVLPKCFPDL